MPGTRASLGAILRESDKNRMRLLLDRTGAEHKVSGDGWPAHSWFARGSPTRRYSRSQSALSAPSPVPGCSSARRSGLAAKASLQALNHEIHLPQRGGFAFYIDKHVVISGLPGLAPDESMHGRRVGPRHSSPQEHGGGLRQWSSANARRCRCALRHGPSGRCGAPFSG